MNCPNCHEKATPTLRKRWRIVRPIFPITLLNLGTVDMRRGTEHRFKCPNCNGIFFFTSQALIAAPVTVRFELGVAA